MIFKNISCTRGGDKMEFKAIIFDMDGTLVDSLYVWNIIWESLGKKYLGKEGFRPTTEDDRAVRTMTLAAAMDLIHKNYELADNGEQLLRDTDAVLEDFYANTVLPKEGVMDFLESCYKKGTKMCIASATDLKLVKIALKHCRMEKYFPCLFSCKDIGRGKDFPDIFLFAAGQLGANISDTWVFEDSCTAVKTAKAAGFNTVGIYDLFNYGQDEIKETATIYVGPGESLSKLI